MNGLKKYYLRFGILVSPLLMGNLLIAQQSLSSDAPAYLPRLVSSNASGKSQATQFSVDALDISPSEQGRKSKKNDQDVLELAGRAEFSRPLRAQKDERTYVSFAAFASQDTIITIGDALLKVTQSPVLESYATLLVKTRGSDWVATGLNVPVNAYDGNRLATLPVLTVRLDPAKQLFDVYANARLLVEGAAYPAKAQKRKFRVEAGPAGVWLMGLVQSDINPLYVDENHNGVDDDFELALNGELLAAEAPPRQRQALVQEWRKTERLTPPPALFRQRPLPDGG
jgi:hypothetical protein